MLKVHTHTQSLLEKIIECMERLERCNGNGILCDRTKGDSYLFTFLMQEAGFYFHVDANRGQI